MAKIVRLTESDLNRIVKRVIKEQTEVQGDKNWKIIKQGLMSTSPKILTFKDPVTNKPAQSLNYGSHKSSGFDWGLSLGNDGKIVFQTSKERKSKIFIDIFSSYGIKIDEKYYFNTRSGNWGDNLSLRGLDPQRTISLVKQLIGALVK